MSSKNNIPTENYKFTQNKQCEYFPCHQISDESKFNCLFCYCPLYMLKDNCGGNFRYKNGIKDCSQCTLTHLDKAYNHVMSKMRIIMEKAKIK